MALIQSKKDGHFLTFNTDTHIYQLDGRRVPGGSTFSKGGYPTSVPLQNWAVGLGSAATVALVLRLLKNKPKRLFTEALKDAIIKRAKKAKEKNLRKTADVGSLTHDWAYLTEMKDAAKLAELGEKIKAHKDRELIERAINKFIEWKAANKDELIGLEQIVGWICPPHRIGQSLPEGVVCLCFAGKYDRLYQREGLAIIGDYKTAKGFYLDHHIQQGAYARAVEYWNNIPVTGLETIRFSKEKGDAEALLISKPLEVARFKRQSELCRETYEFTKLGNDKRWAFGGKK